YINPSEDETENGALLALQQLEYSQGLGVFRCAQALGNAVTVVPGAIGLFEAHTLREILNSKGLRSVTEDSEITLELQEQGHKIGYLNLARSWTVVPSDFKNLWNQRIRWFVGWLHNSLDLHRTILFKRRWLSLLLWYCLIIEYFGAAVELGAVVGFPFLLWFAPDRVLFTINLLWFGGYAFVIGTTAQAIAVRFAYGKHNHRSLLYYTPFYFILWLVNSLARLSSLAKYSFGYRGKWNKTSKNP
ncbi:MAG: glycosyltransferase family 2 protein, partial [Candidatus Bathyarchaeota archaeon]